MFDWVLNKPLGLELFQNLSLLCWKLYFGKTFFMSKYLSLALVGKFQRLYVKHIHQASSISWKVNNLDFSTSCVVQLIDFN